MCFALRAPLSTLQTTLCAYTILEKIYTCYITTSFINFISHPKSCIYPSGAVCVYLFVWSMLLRFESMKIMYSQKTKDLCLQHIMSREEKWKVKKVLLSNCSYRKPIYSLLCHASNFFLFSLCVF